MGDDAREIVAAAQKALPALEAAVQPCGPEAVKRACERLAIIFPPSGNRTDRHWEALAHEYVAALADLPPEALRRGVEDWRDDPESRFFPFPGQLKGKAEVHAKAMHAAVYRARMLAAAKERAVPPPPTEAELAERRRLAEETKALLRPKPMPEMDPAAFEAARSARAEEIRRQADDSDLDGFR